jgi:hypothetical protein
MIQHGKEHRLHRKYIRQQLGTTSLVARFYPLLEKETCRFLWRISQDSENLVPHLKK